MTLLYLFIFKIILFSVYHSYTLGLVRLDLYTCLGSYSVYPSDPWVTDRYCVGVVLIPYLSAIVPNMPDRGVVRDSDTFIDSCPPLVYWAGRATLLQGSDYDVSHFPC